MGSSARRRVCRSHRPVELDATGLGRNTSRGSGGAVFGIGSARRRHSHPYRGFSRPGQIGRAGRSPHSPYDAPRGEGALERRTATAALRGSRNRRCAPGDNGIRRHRRAGRRLPISAHHSETPARSPRCSPASEPPSLATLGSGRRRRGDVLGPRARVPQSCGAGARTAKSRPSTTFDIIGRRLLSRHLVRPPARGRARRTAVPRLCVRAEQGFRARSRCRDRWSLDRPSVLPPGFRPTVPNSRKGCSGDASTRDRGERPPLWTGV